MYHLSQVEIEKIAEAIIAKLPVKDEIMTTEQVADMLGISVASVHSSVSRGTLPRPHKRGNRAFYSLNELTRWLLDDEYVING